MTSNLTNLQLLELSNDAYDGMSAAQKPFESLGYEKVAIDLDAKTTDANGNETRLYDENFSATAYYDKTNNKLVISYAGTDDLNDLFVNDPGYVAGYEIPQFKDAVNFYDAALKSVKDNGNNVPDSDITITGHSHGGGLGEMVGVLKNVEAKVFNAPGIGSQLNNIEEYDNDKGDQIKSGQLTSQDPSLFKVTNIYLDSDVVHLAGNQIGTEVAIDSSNSVFGTALYALFGAAGTALTTGPVGVAYGILGKFVGSGISNNHMISGLKEALENQEKINSGQSEETTTEKFLSAVGSINSYIDKGISSVTDIVNKTMDWLTSGHVTQDLVGAAKDAWDSTVSFFDGLFSGYDGSAPTNPDGTVNTGLIDNSFLNLDIRTDLTKNFLSNNNITQTGNIIGDGDWEASAPINNLNGDGLKNVAPYSIVSDQFRPGNSELSQYSNLNFELKTDFSQLNNLNAQLNNSSNSNILNQQLNFQLQNPLADLTNNSINARTFTNIDPVVLDLNGDGVKLTSYSDSEVTFDVDNDGKQERTGWVSSQDGILVDDKNHNGKIDNITETISEYYNPNDGSVADADGKYSTDGLAALKKLDSNNDGKFDRNDEKWNDLKVWTDVNGNGVTDNGELKTLTEAGIKEIDLASVVKANKERNEGNIVFSKSTYTTTDGQTKEVAAVDFTTNPIGYEFNDVNLGKLATAEDGTKSLVIAGKNGETVTASASTAQNIFGNVGDDKITGDERDNWISGGAGSDTLKGGDGDDILIIDAEDKQWNIDAGNGRDVVIVNSDKGIHFNLAQANVETVVGGNGNDILISGGSSNTFIDGGSGDDTIIGGAADDALSGSDGDDFIDGGFGDDIIRGHRGQDFLNGGAGDDYLDGGVDNDTIFGDDGNDIMVGGAGSDYMDGGAGYNLAKYQGSYADFNVQKIGSVVKVTDLKTGDVDTIMHVDGIRFNDVTVNLNDISNNAPLSVGDTINLLDKNKIFISKDQLLANDWDIDGDSLQIPTIQNVIGGTLSLVTDANGKITGIEFTPDKNYNGVMSFDYTVADSKGASATITQYSNDGTQVSAPMRSRVEFKIAGDPNDPLYTKQWYLSEIKIRKVWDDYTGNGVKIGVFENGDFNIKHQDLDDNTLQSYKDDVAFRQVDQYSQHKTTVAGVIAAERNDYGIVGVAYNSKLDGYSWESTESGLENLKNVDVANNSWINTGKFADNFSDPNNPNAAYAELLEDSVKLGRSGLGTVNVFGGGNSRAAGDNVNYHNLQNSRFAITTGSINQTGDLGILVNASTPFSNPGAAILVSAPGSNIQSTGNVLENNNGSTFLGEFSSNQGTSYSAPIVSGVVALMLEANPNLGYRDIQKILALSAHKFVDPNTVWQNNGSENWNGGAMHTSDDYGYGEVDALAAVRLAETWKETNNFYNEKSYVVENSDVTTIGGSAVINKTFTVSNSNLNNIEVVEVALDLSQVDISHLKIALVSPSGTRSILVNNPKDSAYSNGLKFNFSSRQFLGEKVDGDWKIEITDSVTGDAGHLNNAKISFFGKLDDGKNDVYIYTDEFSQLNDASRSTLNDNDGGTDTLNAAAVSGDSIINLNAGQTSVINGKNLVIGAQTSIENAYSGDGNDTIIGNDSGNILYAGRGHNTLTGNGGYDVFVIKQNSSTQDSITDFVIGEDKIDLSDFDGLKLSDLHFSQDGSDLIIDFNSGQKILLKNISLDHFSSSNSIILNSAPVANDDSATVDEDHSVTVKVANNDHDDNGNVANYNIKILSNPANGSIAFNGTGDLIYKPNPNFNGADSFEYSLIDSSGVLSPKAKVNIVVNPVSDAPVVVFAITDKSFYATKSIDLKVGNTFVEVDGEKLQYSATLSDGSPLPDWLSFDSKNLVFSGIAPSAGLEIGVKLTATDSSGDSNSVNFNVIINNALFGTEGQDTINPGSDDYVIFAGAGDDIVNAGVGHNSIYGGDGKDKIVISRSEGTITEIADFNHEDDVIDLSALNNNPYDKIKDFSDLNLTQEGDDVVISLKASGQVMAGTQSYNLNINQKIILKNTNIDQVTGKNFTGITDKASSTQDLYINYSDFGGDKIITGSGNDTIVMDGFGGNTIRSGAGDDKIYLHTGNNTIKTGSGNDTIFLSSHVFSGNDIIEDFDPVNDKIDISDLFYLVGKKFSDLKISQQGSDVVLSGLSRSTFAIRTLTFKNIHLSDISEKNFVGINANPTEGDDVIYGTSSSDNINSLAGNDTIKGGDGDDVLNGGDGNDNIDGGSGVDTLYGDSGSDQINGGDGNDQIFGGVGNDTLNGGNGDDIISGGDGDDKIYGNSGVNTLSGGSGADIFFIENGSGITDTITDFSVVNGDQIDVSSVSDVGSFATLKILQQGQDTLVTISSDQQILLKNVNASDIKESSFNGLKKDIVINGSKFDDILSVDYDYAGIQSTLVDGKAGNDTIYGSSQDDVILGGDGNDNIIGGGGNDTISGNAGSDKFIFQNTYSYSDSKTVITDFEIGSDKIKFDGVTGINGFGDLSISDGIDGAVISFKGTNSWSPTVTNNQIVLKGISANQIGANDFEFKNTINGTSGNDNIIASDQDNYIYGNGGDDVISAGAGDDGIMLSSGQNTVYAGRGNDTISVYDFYSQNSTPAGGKFFGEEGDDELLVYSKGKYELSGGSGNDYFDVSVLDSTIDGGDGDDNIVLSTINGYDYINQTNFVVGGGNTVHGGSGNDIIEVYSGNGNTIYGDDGVDKFIIDYSPNSVTTIADFDLNEKIDLQNMDVKSMSDLEISQSGSDLLIKFKDNQSVLLKNISQLSEQNIIFKVSGTSGNDVIQNASGNSIMSGGGGSDTFVISKDPNSQKEIVDFDYNNPNEKIQLKGFSEIKDFSDISIQYQQSGFLGVINNVPVYSYDAHVNLGEGQTLVIKNAPKDSIKLDSFVFYQNSDPVANDISSTVSEDGSVIIDLLAQASDIDGDTLSVQITNPTNGTAELIGNGRIKYTPNHNYNGNDSFEYKLSDGNGGFVSKAVNLNITSANDVPTIKSVLSNSVVSEDAVNTVLTAAVVADAFSDIDGDVLNYKASLSNGNPLPSWLSINSTTGEIISTNPSNNDVGNHELIVTATDSLGASVSQNFVVTVNNVNDAPTASLITASTNEDSATITLAFAVSDIDASDSLSYSILSNPSLGSVINNNDGTFTFNLGNDFQNLALGQTKDVSFTYAAIDKAGAQSNISTATITITGTNDAPTASITSIATDEDNSIKIDVLAGAVDIDAGEILSLTSVTNGLHGNASITTDANGNKIVSYVPNANYNGSDVITYTISDSNGGSVTKELTVTVNAVNDAPIVASVAQDQAAESGKAFTYTLSNNLFSDVDSDNLTINATLTDGSPLPSWLSFDGNKFSGTPNVSTATNFVIKLTATDPSGASVSLNFGINITNPNNAPVAKDDAFATNEDTSLTISFAAILKNDSDIEDKTNIQKLTKDNIIFNNPANGTITVTDTGIIYKPNKDYNGSDVVTYQIKDSGGALSNVASINLTVKPVNDIAVAGNDSFVTDEDKSITIKLSDLLANDLDVEDGAAIQSLTIDKFVFSNPSKGVIVKDAVNGTITYTPNKNYNGTDSLTYQIKDSKGALSNKATISLTVNAVNDAPVAANDSFTLNEDTPLTINFASILKNDSDVEDGANIQKITKDNIIFNNPANGKITITDTGIIYTPNKDFNGIDSLTYQIKDSNGALSNVANINLTIKSVNDAPVAASDFFVTDEDTAITIKIADLLANDFDVEDGVNIQNTTFDKVVFSNPGKGVIVKDAVNGTITYTPNKNYNGSDVITYQIKDSSGTLSNKAAINLTVNAINDAPVAVNDSFSTNEDTALTITFASILKNDSDVEDGVNIKNLTKDNIIFSNPEHGTITVTDTGIIYAPNKDFNGSDSLTYQIKDSSGALSNSATISLTIKPVNDTPVAASDSFIASEDTPITIKLADLLANDFDVEDGAAIQSLTLDKFVFSNPSKGKIVKDTVNNTIIYTPNKDYNGSDSLTYQIKDSNGTLSNKATINFTIESVNDAPVIGTKLANQSVKAGNLFNYTLPANSFTDVDKDALTYSAKLADGSDLPSWLKFDSATKAFSGTSPSSIASALSIKVTASDGSLDASQSFSLNITSNVINGNSGNNSLNGTALNDEIYGNDGIDTIKGNAGNDLIIGGKGADVLLGGIGNDQFIFKNLTDSTINESDLILDFIKGEDKINLSGLGFDEIRAAGNNHSDHGLEYHFDGKNTVIEDHNSNFAVKLAGDISLDHNDFAF